MITILAEKPDVGNKIAAALDGIVLSGGKRVEFQSLKANEKAVKAQQTKDGFLKIRFDGQDCYVTWGFGHLVELKQAKDYNPDYTSWSKLPLPFIPEHYETQLRQMPSARDQYGFNAKIKRQFKIIKDLFSKSSSIINATDDDREGEVIFSYIYDLAGCKKPVKRVCFSSQTREGIRDAFKKLIDGKERENIRNAGYMRSIADWVIGSNLTVAMTLQNHADHVLSIGRVQTPTLAMVVRRELAARDFKSAKYWTVTAEFTDAATGKKKYRAEHETKRFEKREDAEAVYKAVLGKQGIVKGIEKKRIRREAPNLYSLSSLQMEANSRFGYTLKQTLEIAQSLYDAGYTTYPRTNSQYLTEDMEPVVNKTLDALQTVPEYRLLIDGRARKYDRPRYFDNKKVESHYAIIPTGSLPSSMTPQQKNIYDLISRSVIKMLYGPAVLEKTTVVTAVEKENFISSGTLLIDPGWTVCGGGPEAKGLPDLSEGEAVDGEYAVNEKETEPPKRYTEKTLLAAMLSAGKDLEDSALKKIMSDLKVKGIGTEATRAAIIETLVARGYIERKGKTIFATEQGIALIHALPLEEIKSAELTAQWESRLDEIAKGREEPGQFQKDIEQLTVNWCGELTSRPATAGFTSADGVCPICGGTLKNMKYSWKCMNAACGFQLNHTICGKKLTEKQETKILTKGDSGVLSGFQSKAGKSFQARLVLNREQKKAVFQFQN